jgi:hypothetical protein
MIFIFLRFLIVINLFLILSLNLFFIYENHLNELFNAHIKFSVIQIHKIWLSCVIGSKSNKFTRFFN